MAISNFINHERNNSCNDEFKIGNKRILVVTKFVYSKLNWVVSGGWLLYLLIIWLIPTSVWFDVKQLHIDDVKKGDPIPISFLREINQDFLGTWSVTIVDVTSGSPESRCPVSRTQRYSKDAKLPKEVTLRWLTAGECLPLPAGKYIVYVDYHVHTSWFMWDKYDSVVSNIFVVKE